MATGTPANLQDILQNVQGYQADEEFSPDELSWVRQNFGGLQGKKNANTLRKFFVPTVHDPELPVEGMANDPWMIGVDFKSVQLDQLKAIVMGRQEAIKLVMNGLVALKVRAATGTKSKEELAANREKDSAK